VKLDSIVRHFNPSSAACAVGPLGGRQSARIRRVRPADQNPFLQSEFDPETAREAVLALDDKFPWLRGAEHRPMRWPRATPPAAAEII
jgi:hypothetical protein